MSIAERIEKMSDAKRLDLLLNYEEFEEAGAIGDCVLRDAAKSYIKDREMNYTTSVVLIMRDFAFEAYRYYAKKVL